MAFLLWFIVIYAFLLMVVPKGIFLYEMLRLPYWAFKMRTYPKTPFLKDKYFYGKHFRQYVLYYQPESKQDCTRNQVVVYFHGGGWQFGRPEMFRPNAQLLVEKGYRVFMPSHRRIPLFNISRQRDDIAMAMAKVVEIMDAEGIGDKKILLGGMSSGANLAGLLAFDNSLLESVGLKRNVLAGIFLLGAPVNLYGMWHSPPLWMLAGKRSGELFLLANPINFLEEKDPMPVFMMHPELDGMVEFSSVKAFVEKMRLLRFKNVKFIQLSGMVHMDAASWCFEGHPSQKPILDWLYDQEKKAE